MIGSAPCPTRWVPSRRSAHLPTLALSGGAPDSLDPVDPTGQRRQMVPRCSTRLGQKVEHQELGVWGRLVAGGLVHDGRGHGVQVPALA